TNTVVTTISEPCPFGITLSSQADVNLFGVNFSECTEIDGQLIYRIPRGSTSGSKRKV
ncbi:MAG: hypothetical protein ACI9Y7_002819, partial [Dokdonia sp.]